MLTLQVQIQQLYDEETNSFIYKTEDLQLEHCLAAISKWESIWEIPFLSKEPSKTNEQTISYIRCMCMDEVKAYLVEYLSQENMKDIVDYISKKSTALPDKKDKKAGKSITSETLYYLAFAYGLPIECQYWHLNRLLSLIRLIQEKNEPPRKMTKREIMERNRKLNAERRAKLKSKG